MDKLEKAYKEKLYGYESDVSSSVWSGISDSLDKNKRNRRIFLFLSFLAFLILLLSAIYYFLHTDTESTKPQLKPLASKAITRDLKSTNTISDAKINNSEVLKEQKIKIQSDDDNLISREISELISNLGNPNLSSAKQLDDFIAVNPVKVHTQNDVEKIPGRSFAINSNDSKNNLHYNIIDVNTDHSTIPSSKKKGFLDDCFPSRINSWLVEVYGAAIYGDKSMKGDNAELISSRENSENPLMSISTGIRLGYNYKGAVFKSGFDYTSINEKFHIVLKNVTSTQTIITIDTVKYSDGTFTITRDTTIKELYGEEDIKKFNSYRSLGIPFILGYELKYRKHTFGLNAGIIINLVMLKSGYVLNEKGERINLDLYGDNIFVNRTGASLYSSLFYAYYLNKRFAIFVEPRFTYNLFPITKKEYAIKQKYLTYGISFGGRYLF